MRRGVGGFPRVLRRRRTGIRQTRGSKTRNTQGTGGPLTRTCCGKFAETGRQLGEGNRTSRIVRANEIELNLKGFVGFFSQCRKDD